jgi:uncharacterized repeat protein (TIGR03803 family)
MKIDVRNMFLAAAFSSAVLAISADAQLITPLRGFTGLTDGGRPVAGLASSSNVLYGTALLGGRSAQGTVFRIGIDGTGFRTLRDLRAANTNLSGVFTNSDGINPSGALVILGSTLYGTASQGGTNGSGTVFKLKNDGTSFGAIYNFTASNTNELGVFTNSDGMNPLAALALSGRVLYGTAFSGGTNGTGTLFKLNNDGTGFAALRSFTAGQTNSAGVLTNLDGINPTGALVVSGNTLYGTASAGGTGGVGTVFKVLKDGTGFSTLRSFTVGTTNASGLPINIDGMNPQGSLTLAGNVLYGTASGGGRFGSGTIFKMNIDGSGFVILRHFLTARTNSSGLLVNNDGMNPGGSLILSDNTLFGTTTAGGVAGVGNVFRFNTDATGFRVLHAFTPAAVNSSGILANSEGANPAGALILVDNVLFGTAAAAGRGGAGTVFRLTTTASTSASSGASHLTDSITTSGNTVDSSGNTVNSTDGSSTFIYTAPVSIAPSLTVSRVAGNLVLSWPANSTPFTLESTPNLTSPVVWTTVSPAPIVINGRNTVTNRLSSTQQFYRLRQ